MPTVTHANEQRTDTQSTKLNRCSSTAVSQTEKSLLRFISGLNTEDATTQPRVRPVRPETMGKFGTLRSDKWNKRSPRNLHDLRRRAIWKTARAVLHKPVT